MKDGGGVDIKFQGMISGFKKTVAQSGWKGLWRGNIPNLCKVKLYHILLKLIINNTALYNLKRKQ